LYKDTLDRLYTGKASNDGPGTTEELLDFLGKMRERGNSPATINIHLKALRTFYRWAMSQEHIDRNPMQGIPMAKEQRTLCATLSESQCKQVVTAAGKSRNGARDTAILHLFLDLGLRPGELRTLRLEDVSLEQDTVKVAGKMGERMLPFSQSSRKALLAWLRKRPTESEEDALFLTERGAPFSRDALRDLFRHLQQKAGLSGRFYPYLLRHTAATTFLQNGGSMEMVRLLLGHTTYAVTQRYLSLTHSDLAKAQRKYSPVRNLR
jgi:site-specific recombinase XerD